MRAVLVSGMAVALAGCGGPKPAENVATPQEATLPANDAGGVARQDVSATPAPTPAPTTAALQEQPGPGGSRVALIRVAVTGDVLTVQLAYSANTFVSSSYPVDRLSVIDDATAQQIGILKDAQGRALAAPLETDAKQVRLSVSKDAPTIVWFKFPAPPASSKTVSINIPEVGPFDGVPVTR